jgi:predicted HTH domain antitoxin
VEEGLHEARIPAFAAKLLLTSGGAMASRLPLELEEELAAVTEAGIYKSREAVLVDAVNTFLAARPDLREEIACRLYEKDVFSLGRAAEWAGLSIEELKESLYRRGIARHTSDPAEMEAMIHNSLEAARRAGR